MSKWKDNELLIGDALVPAKIGSEMALPSRSGRSIYQAIKPTLLKLQSFCSTCALIVCVVLLILSLLAVIFKPLNKVVHVVFIDNHKPPLHATSPKFLSVALDSTLIADGFRNFNMSNPKLLKLMMPLAPAYLRIGGTMADRLWFAPDGSFTFKTNYLKSELGEIDGGECSHESFYCDQLDRPNFTMSGSEWLQLNGLAKSTGFTVLFDLNALIRHADGSWNADNAETLIAFSNEHNLDLIWELGNEPNRFKNVFNYEVNASQLAKDFVSLRGILNRYPGYRNSLLVGPDTTRPIVQQGNSETYLRTFLREAGNAIDAVTWHQYYFNSKTATSSDFLSLHIFDTLEEQINIIKDIVKGEGDQSKPIWLGETASSYGGGAPGYSNRYIASFIWLDKLGLAAKNGLDVVIRQTLFKGYYALLDEDLEPTPDWWLSVMYKSFVGPEVVPCYSASSLRVRLYCHCSTRKSLYSMLPSITVFGMNMKSTEANVRLEGLFPLPEKHPVHVYAYVLTPYLTLLSKYVQLNNEILQLLPSGDLPPFKPRIVSSEPYLVMPPYSLVFWVIPSSLLDHCRSGFQDIFDL